MPFYYFANSRQYLKCDEEPYGMFRGTCEGTHVATGKTHKSTQLFESEEVFHRLVRIWSLTIHWKYKAISCERIPYPNEKAPEISFDI